MNMQSGFAQGLSATIALFVFVTTANLARAENYAFLVAVQDYSVKSLRPLRFTRNDIQEFAYARQKTQTFARIKLDVPRSWKYGSVFARSSFRGRDTPAASNSDIGFRAVRTVPER